MIRYTKDGKLMMGIFMENTHLLTKQFPYQLPRPDPEFCEIGELQLQNQVKITPNMCFFCPENNWHYHGSFLEASLNLLQINLMVLFLRGVLKDRFIRDLEGTPP